MRVAPDSVSLAEHPHPALSQRHLLRYLRYPGNPRQLKVPLDPTPLKTVDDPL
jgi:hypothetical protein